MRSAASASGLDELRAARSAVRGLLLSVFVFSLVLNLLAFTGPIFMLQVYDRVLGSGSEETLAALLALVAFLFLMMGVLDHARGRIMARVAEQVQDRLETRVLGAMLRAGAVSGERGWADGALHSLDSLRRVLTLPVFLAVFDVVWTPALLAAMFVFHPWMGALALSGGLALVAVSLLNHVRTRKTAQSAGALAEAGRRDAEHLYDAAETVAALGMSGSALARWRARSTAAMPALRAMSDRAGLHGAVTRALRMFLQSAMLGLGALLVLRGELTAGAMVASAILMGRALAPIELMIGQWEPVMQARRSWSALGALLAAHPPQPPRIALPRPDAVLDVHHLTLVPPGETHATLRLVSFKLQPGQAMGVIGPSGAGKTTLARALTGVWPIAGGHIRLDGAALDQYDPDALGRAMGYLPQRVALFDGTIAENIARLDATPDAAAVVAAARKAAAHDMILKLPQGYDTRLSAAGGCLSGGQMQRVGLARALYGDPVLLILDEPNANLDNDGSEALNAAIREMKAAGKAVIVLAHRPGAIMECDLLMVLDGGVRTALGPRDSVLEHMVTNHTQLATATRQGGLV
ncbi:type I secretion system permease/ATPase [Vannielia litorea]|uniref:ATP-binding cassette, subfamily C n=1 Tax=Vannielia litorea TaxID=1217970 RepID=A0A1N6H808_9RHOB|nr:type I secretion system permease/ATPase [Vannielia litorea]SIO15892.1 ATP-binding cassette, subfamily C [Vannielia litorea]